MAKILFGDGITDARGKVGGSVYTKNRYGAVRRRKVTPSNPRSSAQTNVRALFSALTKAFRSLTAAEIAAWNSAVQNFKGTNIFKQSKVLTGHALYMKLNRNLDSIATAHISTPPLPSAVGTNSIASVLSDTGGAAMSVTLDAVVAAGTALIVEATPGMSAGKQPSRNQFRQLGVFAAAHAAALDVKALYVAVFGSQPAVGTKVGFRVKNVSSTTGEATTGFQESTITV